jgi:hypothetical protein
MPMWRPLRAARANRVFCTDEKRIRAENTVMNGRQRQRRVLEKIVDRVWTISRPRNIVTLQQ